MNNSISIRGASEHNLKNVDVDIPKHSITALSGPSGAGKRSLAFDTLSAESHYRLRLLTRDPDKPAKVSHFARPALVSISNLPPVIALDRPARHHRRETVASLLGLGSTLYQLAAAALRLCPYCSAEIISGSLSEAAADLGTRCAGKLVAVTTLLTTRSHSEQHPEKSEAWQAALTKLLKKGYTRIICRQTCIDLDHTENLEQFLGTCTAAETPIEVVIDRLELNNAAQARLLEALRQADALQNRGIGVHELDEHSQLDSARYYSKQGICSRCGYEPVHLNPAQFNFRVSSKPAHPSCNLQALQGLSALSPEKLSQLLAIRIPPLQLGQILTMEMQQLLETLTQADTTSANALAPVAALLHQLCLSHLTMSRAAASLSAAELIRLNLAQQILKPLKGVLYTISEPATGLHASEHAKLFQSLRRIRDQGNSIVLITHSSELLCRSDHVIMLGPGSGAAGGSVVAQGSPQTVYGSDSLPELQYVDIPSAVDFERVISLRQACMHNLQKLDASFPLQALSCVTGVAGAGKASLVMQTLLPALEALVRSPSGLTPVELSALHLGAASSDSSIAHVTVVKVLDPVNNPLSLVCSYCGLLDPLRKLFAGMPLSKLRGYSAATFALGSGKTRTISGRCEQCQGSGRSAAALVQPGSEHPCPACNGSRFKREILDVRFKGLSLPDIFSLTAEQAVPIVGNVPKCGSILSALGEFQLAYLSLGQPLATLSSGELQRLRLLKLIKRNSSSGVYIFDQLTTGLSRSEVLNLIQIVKKLVQRGNTVVAIEHDLDFICAADYLIELGPEAGCNGGCVTARGELADVLNVETSHTGKILNSRIRC